MRALNIPMGILLLLLMANEFFNLSSFTVSDFIIGVALVLYGLAMIGSSIVFQSSSSIRPGSMSETSSTGIRWGGIFLGLACIFVGICNLGLFGLEFLSTTATVVLGFLLLISK